MTAKARAGFIVGLLISFAWPGPSQAAPITWQIEGTVRIVDLGERGELADSLGVSVGAPVSASMTFDPEYMGGYGFGNYVAATLGFEVAIGAYETGFHYGYGCCYTTVNFDPVTGAGSYSFWGGVVGADLLFPNGAPISLLLFADTPGVIPSLAFPLDPPLLSGLRPFSAAAWTQDYVGTGLELGLGHYGQPATERVVIELTRLERVPEPGAIALFAPALLALAALRCRAW